MCNDTVKLSPAEQALSSLKRMCDPTPRAGQGMVQFARGVKEERDFAEKLFVARDAETAPCCRSCCQRSRRCRRTRTARPSPPFIVMEKGEAPGGWRRRAKPDMFQSTVVRAPSPLPVRLTPCIHPAYDSVA